MSIQRNEPASAARAASVPTSREQVSRSTSRPRCVSLTESWAESRRSRIRERRLSAQLSVKLTHLGLDVDRETCSRDVGTLAARAAEAGSFLWIDMEESRYVDAALEVFQRARAKQDSIGLCLQAYLRR